MVFLSLQYHFILVPSINERDASCGEEEGG